VHLVKVPAHAGVIGNVKADHIADGQVKAHMPNQKPGMSSNNTQGYNVAEGCTTATTYIDEGNAPFEEVYWPNRLTEKYDARTQKTVIRRWTLANLTKEIRKHTTEVHALGYSNQSSLYFQGWNRLKHAAHVKASNHFMTSGLITHTQRKRMLQYRTGTLPTNKMLHRINKSHPNTCPLCGQLDGGHHAVAACPEILTPICIPRHHAAGRAILKAVAKGRLGAALHCADVGRKELMDQEDMGNLSWGLPTWLTPVDADLAAVHWPPSRPDGLIVILEKGRSRLTSQAKIVLIELKYCLDRDRQPQRTAALEQHAELSRLLVQWWGCEVRTQVILLGTGGTIFTVDTEDALEDLGVTGAALTTLLNKLNRIAVEYVEKALKYRWSRSLTGRRGDNGGNHSTGHPGTGEGQALQAPRTYQWTKRKRRRTE
jgi:hypothetical protein